MDVKWQKNSHILIKSQSGYITADNQYNIRRTFFLGRIWFQIKDWYTKGGETAKLNCAIEKTLEAVRKELGEVKKTLLLDLEKLPATEEILEWDDPNTSLDRETKINISKVHGLIRERLILTGRGGTMLFGIPNYNYRTECLRDLPQAITEHRQVNPKILDYETNLMIKNFFSFDYIESLSKKKLVMDEVNRRDKDWAG